MATSGPDDHRMAFFSMGMFILDEIVFSDSVLKDVIGGAGTYAVVGAGLFVPEQKRHMCGMIVDEGSDFPAETKRTMDQWKLGLTYRVNDNRKTTRGLNVYTERDTRKFEYLNPPLRIELRDLLDDPSAADALVMHLICSPSRCIKIAGGLREYHAKKSTPSSQMIIWEPVPTSTAPDDWTLAKQALHLVDVVSPNAKEAASFLGLEEPDSKTGIEELLPTFSENFKGLLVIRSGPLGAVAYKDGKTKWYPAYHQNPEKVVDPTGGGNSFLGGLGLGLSLGSGAQAMVYGIVAAALAIEQVGLPVYDSVRQSWNDTEISERLSYYIRRENIDLSQDVV